MTLLAVYTTVANHADAARLAEAAVSENLAACVQAEEISSTYRWQGAVQHAPEVRLLFKTTRERCDALIARIEELHPYELPAIFALETALATNDYENWVVAATTPGPNGERHGHAPG